MRRHVLAGYLGTVALVAVATGAALLLQQEGNLRSAAPVFMLAIICSAIRFGAGPSLLACATSGLAYDFFFLPPIYAFEIAATQDVVALAFYVIVALIIAILTARSHAQAIAATDRARMMEGLFRLSSRLAAATDREDVASAAVQELSKLLHVDVYLFLPGRCILMFGSRTEDATRLAQETAERIWSTGDTGAAADTAPPVESIDHFFMRVGGQRIGLVGVPRRQGAASDPERVRFCVALIEQTALAVGRTHLMEQLETARSVAESDRLLSALFASISHDLRTPLAAILGSADVLLANGSMLDQATQGSLCMTIRDEAHRLNRSIANLLDMTRLETGVLQPRSIPTDLADVISPAVMRSRPVTTGHRVDVTVARDMPTVALDPTLLEHVIFNLLDNAAKYSPPASRIELRAYRDGDAAVIEVIDEGMGIPTPELDRVFDKFYRVEIAGRLFSGTGLGLAICRGFIDAMGGRIVASHRNDRPGSILRVCLPIRQPRKLRPAPRHRAHVTAA